MPHLFGRSSLAALFLASLPILPAQASAVSDNGKLNVNGLQLVNAQGRPIQAPDGVSTQGTQYFPWGTCPNPDSINMAVHLMGADIYRIPTYVKEGGYNKPEVRAGLLNTLDQIVKANEKQGIYSLIDWHVCSANPLKEPNFSEAKDFFTIVAAKYGGRPDILYEICNEPRWGTPWPDVKKYAGTIIPIIRARDPDALIIVGCPDDSGDLSGPAADPLLDAQGKPMRNIMYTLHFYAGTHVNDISRFTKFADKLPIFVTEWSISSDSGNAPDSYPTGEQFVRALNGDNSARVKVSWIAWSFTHDSETSAMLNSCTGPWDTSNLTPSGLWMRNHIQSTNLSGK